MPSKHKLRAEKASKKDEEYFEHHKHEKAHEKAVQDALKKCTEEKKICARLRGVEQREMLKKIEKLEAKKHKMRQETEDRHRLGVLEHHEAEDAKSVADLLAQDYSPMPNTKDVMVKRNISNIQ